MTARIHTRSKRQAMDWALALLSQGIEPVVDFSEEDGWGLIVPESEHQHAIKVIELYRAENSHWPWRQKFLQRDFFFDWGSIAWAFLIIAFFWISENNLALKDAGVMDGRVIARGEWWRFFTAIFLHADVGHLAANAGLGFVMLGLAMGAYGTGFGLLAAFLAGAGGNVLAWLIDANHRNLGASGMVMGAIGLLVAQSASVFFTRQPKSQPNRATVAQNQLHNHVNPIEKIRRKNPRPWKHLVATLGAGIMLFILLGTSSNSDVLAHFGGFACGLLIGSLLLANPRFVRNNACNFIAGAIFSLMTVVCWWLAWSGVNPTF